MVELAEVDFAWAAGLFEGEGSFSWQVTDGRKYPRATVSSTDQDVLRRFAAIIGVGHIYEVPRRHRPAHWKPIEQWVACGIVNVRILGQKIGPFLGERRAQRLAEMLTWEPAEPEPRRNHCIEPVTPSRAGERAHILYGEPCCDRCRTSRNLYQRQYRLTHAR